MGRFRFKSLAFLGSLGAAFMANARVAWGGISAGATVDATTGAIYIPSGGGLYSTLNLLPGVGGSHITWQLPATASLCGDLMVGFDITRTLGSIGFGPNFLVWSDGTLMAFTQNVGTMSPNMFLRIEIATNGKDFLFQTSPDGVAFTTVRTLLDYAGYYVNDGNPMVVRVRANSITSVNCGPVTANNLVNGLMAVAFDGNSLAAGTNCSTNQQNAGDTNFATSQCFPAQLLRLLPRNDYMSGNFGISGQTTEQMASNAAANVDLRINTTKYSRNVLVAWEITNSYCNALNTKEVAYSDFVSYCNARRAAGWKLVILNVINRTTNLNTRTAADFAAAQVYWNGRLATEFATFADALVDVNALNLQNTVGWDGTHPSDAGYALVAAAIKPIIAPFLV